MHDDDITDEDVERETLTREGDDEPQTFAEWGYRRPGRNGTTVHARDYDTAIDALIEAIGDYAEATVADVENRTRAMRLTAAWSAFATYIAMLGLLRHDFELVGPDGITYWVQEHDRT